jgi:acyl-CoA synthetase (AMP-forming)/AMP-acid ligase II
MGAIASIFPFLTEKLDPALYMERVRELVIHSRARMVITFPEFKEDLVQLLDGSGCHVMSTDEVSPPAPSFAPNASNGPTTHPAASPDEGGLRSAASESQDHWGGELGSAVFSRILEAANHIQPDQIAFLQHSSGTTGLQKGVALSHRSVLNQVRAYSRAIELEPSDVVVSWLPLYHDMGLIAGFVMPIVAGIPLVLMSPFHWVRDPKILLHNITRYHGTLTWLPNFAYNHSVRGITTRGLQGVDLSSLRMVINCSEPCRYDSHRLFLERFRPFGLQEQSLATCYAMAENTFAVTQSPPGQSPRLDWVQTRALQEDRLAVPVPPHSEGGTPMVSCGPCIPEVEVQVVDSHGKRLPDRQVGEIALRGTCMLSGYYRRPDLTEQAIKDGWYLTGDMGYLADGELYVSGRKKDLIIVGGKNVYPQDLEAIANRIPGIVPGRAVAFGVFDAALGSEDIVMVCELETDGLDDEQKREIEGEIRRQVIRQTEVTLADVYLVGRKWLIKTSSGKIARGTNREKYLKVRRES